MIMNKLANKRVLIIGDSMSDGTEGRPGTYGDLLTTSPRTPGQFLAKKIIENGGTVRIQAKKGRSGYSFLKSQDGMNIIKSELADHTPDMVVLFLGTNDANIGAQPTYDAFKIIRDFFWSNGKPVYYIDPPAFPDKDFAAKAEKIRDVGHKLFVSGYYIDSKSITGDMLTTKQGREGDGIHFKMAGSKVYGERLYKSFDMAQPVDFAVIAGHVVALAALFI